MSIAPKQLALFHYPKSKTSHGGSMGIGKRKAARPLCVKRAMHVVMRASAARGRHSLLEPKHAKKIFQLLLGYSRRFDVRIYEYANVSNHLHLIVKTKTKEGLRNFLRAFAGHVAQIVTGAGPRRPLKHRFWDLLVFTRIIEWGRAFHQVKRYVWKNIQQGGSIRRYSPLVE